MIHVAASDGRCRRGCPWWRRVLESVPVEAFEKGLRAQVGDAAGAPAQLLRDERVDALTRMDADVDHAARVDAANVEDVTEQVVHVYGTLCVSAKGPATREQLENQAAERPQVDLTV